MERGNAAYNLAAYSAKGQHAAPTITNGNEPDAASAGSGDRYQVPGIVAARRGIFEHAIRGDHSR